MAFVRDFNGSSGFEEMEMANQMAFVETLWNNLDQKKSQRNYKDTQNKKNANYRLVKSSKLHDHHTIFFWIMSYICQGVEILSVDLSSVLLIFLHC